MDRRTFLASSSSAVVGAMAFSQVKVSGGTPAAPGRPLPMVVSTWPHGLKANEAAWKVLAGDGMALDAVERGVMQSELDPDVPTVGYGSYPDSDGVISLDACITDGKGGCGAVAFLQHIRTPIAVARKVMERTPHVMLAGEGALKFALENGFSKQELHTEFSKRKWREWKRKSDGLPVDVHNHDTISMLAIDGHGDISGACTTGGLAFKRHGRVGDSPIIGAGLFVDNEVGGAGGTGVGEVIMKTLGTHLIVELMRNGVSPQEACKQAVGRALEKVPNARELPVYYIAVNKHGEVGAFGTKKGFEYAVCNEAKGNVMLKADGAY